MLERLPAPLACAAWIAGATPDWARFLRALHDPARIQSRKLAALLGARTAFARAHDFAALRTVRDFQRAVPVRDYDALAPWIARMLDGEPDVLTGERVLMFEKTSGSSGAAKYIPFTASLRREFQAAVRAWMCDLHFHRPALFGGPAYWCITPVARERETTRGGLSVGFESDAEYFAPREQRLLAALLAVPGAIAREPSVEAALDATLRHLLRQPELRFISVWSPSFLTVLLDTLARHAAESRRDLSPARIWPRLRTISCWADGAASALVPAVSAAFPGVEIQPKGLLATEGVVTIPLTGREGGALAVTSHFYEFLPEGETAACLPHELETGRRYSVVLTTGGGLWRYDLGDIVEVTGWAGRTPLLRFAGRRDAVCDLVGEKLHAEFVGRVLETLRREGAWSGTFAMLAPISPRGYALFVQADPHPNLTTRLDAALAANPHYAYARRLGQLFAPRIFRIRANADADFLRRCATLGQRAGGVKPAALHRLDGWERTFDGAFIDAEK